MAEEVDDESKTEEATPRRREEARRQGQIPFSNELVGSVVLLAGVLSLSAFGPMIGSGLMNAFRDGLVRIHHPEFDSTTVQELFQRNAIPMLVSMLPLLAALLVAGVAASVAQAGFEVNGEKLGPKFEKLNPAEGWQRLFSVSSLVRAGLMILKTIALAAVAYWVLEGRLGILTAIGRDRLGGAASSAWTLIMRLATFMSAGVVLVSLLDYVYQRRKFERGLMMTRQELKDEMKQEEGDPQLKARIRQIQRDRARQRMLREVPKSTVVLTNPTHYAVALRYQPGTDAAPVLVAKGTGLMAQRIVKLATEFGVPVLERPTLTRALYSGVKDGHPIPNVLFQAVAEVLAFLYRLRGISVKPSS